MVRHHRQLVQTNTCEPCPLIVQNVILMTFHKNRSSSTKTMSSSSALMSMKYTLVLVRHGESTWNKENLFTGWADVPLSEQGLEEAHAGGVLLREAGCDFDVAYTSTLKRAIKTLWIILEEMGE